MSLQVIRVSREGRVKLLALIIKEGWSGRYLGDNEFVVTQEQIKKIEAENIPFKKVTPNTGVV